MRGLGAVTITVPHYDSVQTVNGKNIMKMGVEKMFDSRVEKEITPIRLVATFDEISDTDVL